MSNQSKNFRKKKVASGRVFERKKVNYFLFMKRGRIGLL